MSITIPLSAQTTVVETLLTSIVTENSELLSNMTVVPFGSSKFTHVPVLKEDSYVLGSVELLKNRYQITFDLTSETEEDQSINIPTNVIAPLLAKCAECVILKAKKSADFLAGVYGVGFDGLLVPSTSTVASSETVATVNDVTLQKILKSADSLTERAKKGSLVVVSTSIIKSLAETKSTAKLEDLPNKTIKFLASSEFDRPTANYHPYALIFDKDSVIVGLDASIVSKRYSVEKNATVYSVRFNIDLKYANSGYVAAILTGGGTNPDPVAPTVSLGSGAIGSSTTITLAQLLSGVTGDAGETFTISNLQVTGGNATLEDV